MQVKLSVMCGQCEKYLGDIQADTADMPEQLQEKINQVVLAHRKDCPYYRAEKLTRSEIKNIATEAAHKILKDAGKNISQEKPS